MSCADCLATKACQQPATCREYGPWFVAAWLRREKLRVSLPAVPASKPAEQRRAS